MSPKPVVKASSKDYHIDESKNLILLKCIYAPSPLQYLTDSRERTINEKKFHNFTILGPAIIFVDSVTASSGQITKLKIFINIFCSRFSVKCWFGNLCDED